MRATRFSYRDARTTCDFEPHAARMEYYRGSEDSTRRGTPVGVFRR